MGLHTIFSVDGSPYQRWQAELLAYSHERINQPGRLTCLVSAESGPAPPLERTFRAPPWSPHPATGDDYPPYNKPSALLSWLHTAPPDEQILLLLDPDCVFITPLRVAGVARGRPLAQPIGYLYRAMDQPDYVAVLRRHVARPDALDLVGIPTIIHRDDLAALAPLWLAKTEAIRDDRVARERVGWIAEMWGYCIAAAELGLRHQLKITARFSPEDRADRPIVHYCWPARDREKRWRWHKKSYRPWERVEDPPEGTPAAAVALVGLLNDLVARKAAAPG